MTRQRHKKTIDVPVLPNRKKVVYNDNVYDVPFNLRVEPVYWAFPMDEILFTVWFRGYVSLDVMPWDHISLRIGTYLPEARNYLHEHFLKTPGCNWMVMLDSDVLPPPDFLQRLMAHDLPMVGGWYRKKGGNTEPVVYDYVKREDDGVHWWRIRKEPGEGLEKVDGAGAGCWLMKREVAEALGPKPYDMEHGGEDLVLCHRVTEKGFPIHIDWSITCAHAGVGLY